MREVPTLGDRAGGGDSPLFKDEAGNRKMKLHGIMAFALIRATAAAIGERLLGRRPMDSTETRSGTSEQAARVGRSALIGSARIREDFSGSAEISQRQAASVG